MRYKYRCPIHSYFTIEQRITDKPIDKCKCGVKVQRIISAPEVIYKGVGYYCKEG